MTMTEESIRHATLTGAAMCWTTSLTLSILIITKTIDNVKHPGLGLIVFTLQGVAITLTIVWAQFRARRVMIEVMKAGLRLGRIDQRATDREDGRAELDLDN